MFLWDKMFETNIEIVDQQHKRLMELINELNAEVIAQLDYDNYDKIMAILSELKNYTIEHFRQEESIMKDTMGTLSEESLAEFWSYYKDHRAQHNDFIEKIEEIYNNNIDDNQDDVSIELINFLIDWIKNHILKLDMQLKKYIK